MPRRVSGFRRSLATIALLLPALAGCQASPWNGAAKLVGPRATGTAFPPGAPPAAPPAPIPPPAPPPPVASAPETLRVLFVGNSLTEANDLAGMVAALAVASADTVRLETSAVLLSGSSLLDQLGRGEAARVIRARRWDVVALQQGPSALPESRVELISSARQFDTIIRAAGGRTAMYMVWPWSSRRFDLDAVIESYTLAALDVNGLLFPAGLAWKLAWQADPSLPLYSSDLFHPSSLGTYVAALCAYGVLRHRSPIGLPSRFDLGGRTLTFPGPQADLAQRAAHEAILASPPSTR